MWSLYAVCNFQWLSTLSYDSFCYVFFSEGIVCRPHAISFLCRPEMPDIFANLQVDQRGAQSHVFHQSFQFFGNKRAFTISNFHGFDWSMPVQYMLQMGVKMFHFSVTIVNTSMLRPINLCEIFQKGVTIIIFIILAVI